MILRTDALTDADAQLLADEGFVPHPTRLGRWVDTTNNNLVLGEAEALDRARKDRARRIEASTGDHAMAGPSLADFIEAGLDRVIASTEETTRELKRMLRALGVDPDAPEPTPMRSPRGPVSATPAVETEAATTTPARPTPTRRRSGRVSQEVLEVLSVAEIEGLSVRLPPKQLERKLYEAVDDVLRACGGKWNRSKRVHLFTVDPDALLSEVINTGVVAKTVDLGWFPTPDALAADIVRLADVRAGMSALEPSAGQGAIATQLRAAGATVSCGELDPQRAADLRALGFAVVEGDALALATTERFDRVVMNPPFAKQADVDHVRHAHAMLAPGGLLVSVMGAGVTFRQDRKASDFRAFVAAHGGTISPLPEGSFRASGTGVSTVVVTIPAADSTAVPLVDVVPMLVARAPLPQLAQLGLFDARGGAR